MFTLSGNPITLVGLLVLFGWCLIWTLRDLLASVGLLGAKRPARNGWAITVSQCCHVVMSLVMLMMVAVSWWRPFSGALTEPVLIGVFSAATLWMAAMAVWRVSWLAVGHTLMFGAMVWHLAAMADMAHSTSSAHSSGAMEGMGGMGSMGGHDMAGQMSGLTLVTGIGLPLMVALVILAVSGLVRVVTARAPHPGTASCCHVAPTSRATARLSGLTDAAMGLGMAWMSAGLMSPLLAFMGHLHP